MTIGVDAFEASVNKRVGVGRLAVEILKNLATIDQRNHYRLYLPDKPLPDLPVESANWHYQTTLTKRLWSQISLPLQLLKERRDLDTFLSLSHYAPRLCPVPYTLFLLDLSFIYFPEMFRSQDLYKLVNWTRYSAAKATKIIAISQATKDDIIKFYKLKQAKIEVVYPGIMPVQKLDKNSSQVLKKYNVGIDYLLYVGTLQPRKNLVRLIEVFAKIVKKYPHLKLVIAGKKGWLYEEIFQKTQVLALENKVIFTGFVADDDLPYLYSQAKALILISLYEGFGFPVLEAMSYGTPVVCSNVSSLPEIAGEAAILVDPTSNAKIEAGLLKVLSLSPQEKRYFQEKGLIQAKKFTWQKAAEKTLAIIESTVKK